MTGKSKVVPNMKILTKQRVKNRTITYIFLITKADINTWFAALYSKAWMSEESIIVVYCF
jgi:hypothetical protein